MRISELSRRAGIPVPTIKYYLREGLLPAGTPSARNQAAYGEDHLRRLRLIRTLREIGGLPIERLRAVVTAIEDDRLSRHELFGIVDRARTEGSPPREIPGDQGDERAEVDAFLAELGWHVRPEAAGRQTLADALASLRRLGRSYGTEVLRPYAEAADRMAALELNAIPTTDPPAVAVERMIVGTVVFGVVFDALRRLAHEHHSAQMTPGAGVGSTPIEIEGDMAVAGNRPVTTG